MTQRNWTTVGREVVNNPLADALENGVPLTVHRVENAISRMEWKEIPKGGTLEKGNAEGLAEIGINLEQLKKKLAEAALERRKRNANRIQSFGPRRRR